MKRIFDIIFSLLVLVFFLPFGVMIALIILFTSKGGVFYLQERIGKGGKPFKLYKFRTMRINADKQGRLTVGMKDHRITSIGVWLRKFKIDEFPQFLNVLEGTMSVVGPRPEVKEFTDLYTQEQRNVLGVKPGITDYASIEYFDENRLLGLSEDPHKTYVEEIMPAKLKLNQKYVQHPTIINDLKIIGLTIKKMLS